MASTQDRNVSSGVPSVAAAGSARHPHGDSAPGRGHLLGTSTPTGKRRSWLQLVSLTSAAASAQAARRVRYPQCLRTAWPCSRRTSAIGAIAVIVPGRAFERTDYRFELVTDYGAFRDLQRHRMRSMEWQRLGISLQVRHGAELVVDAGLAVHYDEAIPTEPGRASSTSPALVPDFPEQASYVIARAGPPHPLRHAVQRVRQCTSSNSAPGHKRPSLVTGGSPSRCTAPWQRSPGTGLWPRR